MRPSPTLTALSLAALVAATLGTAALAERGGPGGHPMMMMPEFSELDANKDGQISPEEVDAFRAARATEIDADGDGKVSLAELVAAETARATERAERLMKERDADGDGMLTAAEMMLPAAPDHMFDRIDRDGDGSISEEEYDDAMQFMARFGRHHRGPGGHGPEGN